MAQGTMREDVQFDAPRAVCWNLNLYIDGRFVEGRGPGLEVENPATEMPLATVAQASVEQVNDAVDAAARAFASGVWRDPAFRRTVLDRMADLLVERGEEFRQALIAECGTPVAISKFLQFDGPVDMLRFFASRTDAAHMRSLGVDERAPRSESVIHYEPAGVAAGIGAYNNPLLYIVSKACAAMAVGCTAVFVPSSLTPLTALLFSEVARAAGVPAGVFNMLVGGPEVARALTLHPKVAKISMTGSVEVGRKVMEQAAMGIKDVILELGGKSAGIILPGADLSTVSMPLHGRYLRNAGQGCMSPTRLLVPQNMYDDFVDHAREAFKQIIVGDPLDPATTSGPLIRERHRARVEGFVDRALADGGHLLAGGGRPDIERGWFMNGALIGGLNNHAELSCSELFGPVAMAMPYRSIQQAIEIANDSAFGLAASVFGPLDLAKDVALRLEAGTVSINGGGNFRVDSIVAGWKQSGTGAEWGEDGLKEYLQPKHIQWTY